MNQASIYWHTQDYEKALQTYDVAKKYLPNDMLLNELMAYNMLFVGRKEEGEKLLKEVIDHLPDHAVCKDSTLEDYFQGFATIDDIKVIFKDVEEDRASVLEKRQALEEVLMHSPKFRSCLMQLATTWLQLHRPSDALEVLKRYHRIDPNNPTVEYYLSVLSALRFEYDEAWRYLKNAERITAERQHYPKALKEIRRELAFQSPEP
jgi:tetratricopeptide (TPR) repeat protein